jgi:hypothetical protein
MKIKDIITEQPDSYQAGKAFAQKATSPSQWGLGGDKDYEGGKAFVNKLLDPGQWFKGGGGKAASDTAPTTKKTVQSPDQLDLGNKRSFEVRRNLDNLISGQYYAADIAVAKSIYDQMNAGTFKPAIDIESTMRSLKKVVDGQTLAPDDLETFKKLKAAVKNFD